MWLVVAAQAHPFGARFAAHMLEVEVGRTTIDVQYVADVPNPLVATATADRHADPLTAMAEELRSGLLLEVDGQSVALQPHGLWTVTPTDDTHQFAWSLRAAIPTGTRRVTVSNGNLPEVTAVYRSRVTVADGLLADACSLWRLRDDEIALDETDRWRTDERNRTLWVDVREPLGAASPLWLWLFPPPNPPPIAADAQVPQPSPSIVGGGALGVLLAIALGLIARRRFSG